MFGPLKKLLLGGGKPPRPPHGKLRGARPPRLPSKNSSWGGKPPQTPHGKLGGHPPFGKKTARRSARNGRRPVRRPSDDRPTAVRRPSDDRPTTVRRPSDDPPILKYTQPKMYEAPILEDCEGKILKSEKIANFKEPTFFDISSA